MSVLDPGSLAWLDRSRAEAREDLEMCLTAYRSSVAEVGEDDAVGGSIVGLADIPEWDRLMLITVLVEALARIVANEPHPIAERRDA